MVLQRQPHLQQADLTGSDVVKLQPVEGLVMAVSVRGAHGWTGPEFTLKHPVLADTRGDIGCP